MVKIEESWKPYLGAEFDKPYFVNLTKLMREEYLHTTYYTPGKLIFKPFNLRHINNVKVVIID